MNAKASDSGSKCVITVLVSWKKDAVTGGGYIYIGVWEGCRRWMCTFCPLNESLTFKSPDA